jgi:hypothetical protein
MAGLVGKAEEAVKRKRRVTKISIGLRKAFKRPRTNAATINACQSPTEMPGTTRATIIKATIFTSQRIKKCIIIQFISLFDRIDIHFISSSSQ